MASRTISLEESAYQLLKQAKRPGESFSMVVNRMLAPREDPVRRMVGLLSAKQGRALEDFVAEQRRLDREGTEARFKRLSLL